MLTLFADWVESLWGEALPLEVKELPEDLAALDRVLSGRGVGGAGPRAFPVRVAGDWPAGAGRGAADDRDGEVRAVDGGQAALPVGYRTLVAEASDSIVLRRFCRISLCERVPDESTVRKLTRRLGSETVADPMRTLISRATRERRFRPRAVRVDSTVVEADVEYPTDSGLAWAGVQALARETGKLAARIGETTRRARSGDAKAQVLELTQEAGELLERSVKEVAS